MSVDQGHWARGDTSEVACAATPRQGVGAERGSGCTAWLLIMPLGQHSTSQQGRAATC
jgi:hypothetical protein